MNTATEAARASRTAGRAALAGDLPDRIAHVVRVQPPGPGWGVAGYSEGGFCAANMALQFRYRYGFAGVLSG